MGNRNLPLRFAIIASGKTQLVIAERAGMHHTALSQILLGYREPTPDQRRGLAKVLRKSQRELFPKASTSTRLRTRVDPSDQAVSA